jgi:hypothetical protein
LIDDDEFANAATATINQTQTRVDGESYTGDGGQRRLSLCLADAAHVSDTDDDRRSNMTRSDEGGKNN